MLQTHTGQKHTPTHTLSLYIYLGLVRPVVGVDGARAADGGDAALLRLLVDDPDEGPPDAVVAQFALHDARAEALVDELSSSLLR